MSMITLHRNQSYPQEKGIDDPRPGTLRHFTNSHAIFVGILRLGPQVDFGLSKQITVVIPTMKVKKMTMASFENLLKHDETAAFEQQVRNWIRRGLPKQVFRAKTVYIY